MLTLYIMKSCADSHVSQQTRETIYDLDPRRIFYNCVSIADIGSRPKDTDWYCVLYDNEYMSEELLEAIETFLLIDYADALIVFKRNLIDNQYSISRSPRFFKKHIELKDSLLPEKKDIVFETILNGFIDASDY